MSADEVLASSLWPWPDPLLKRDQAGNVLFVNAAFLQLYGGQVQDWCGRPLAGWPAPVSAGAQRFETRAGSAPSESVFDWVESVMADGNTLAIARNVTVFMTAPTPPAQALAQTQPEPQVQVQETETETSIAPAQPPLDPVTPQPVLETPKTEASAAAELAPIEQQSAPDLTSEFEDTLSKRADEFAYQDNLAEQAAPQSANIAPPVAEQVSQEITVSAPAPTQEQEPQEEEARMIERRALPIKDSTTVLGSDWRDQVIAKAVGNPGAVEEQAMVVQDEMATETLPGEGLQILLAEDNAINALLTRTLLEAEGAIVDTVEDGALALEAVGQKQYDLVFMDMRMPNMDGLESTRKIRAYGAKMPIIALTANAFDDDRNACFDSGMDDFMTKPVSAEELSEMVVTWTKDPEEKMAS